MRRNKTAVQGGRLSKRERDERSSQADDLIQRHFLFLYSSLSSLQPSLYSHHDRACSLYSDSARG